MPGKKREPTVRPHVLEQLREGVRLHQLLKKTGSSVRFWEVYQLLHTGFFAAAEKAGAGSPKDPFPGLNERVDSLRKEMEPTVEGLRRFLSRLPPDTTEPPPRHEWTLGMVAVSARALENASRWLSAPEKHEEDAKFKLRILEGIVLQYRLALQFPSVGALTWTEEDAGPGEEPVPEPAAEPAPVPEVRKEAPPLPPQAPRGLTAVAGTEGISLKWLGSDGATSYKIMRAAARRGPYKPLGLTRQLEFLDRKADPAASYYYAVKAVNPGGQSKPSNRIPAALAGIAPMRPARLQSSAGDGKVFLFWSAPPGATGYRIKRSNEESGPFLEIARTSETSYVDEDIRNGEIRYYAVSALNGAVESKDSPVILETARPAVDMLAGPRDSEPGHPVGGTALPPGVDPERLRDLRRLERMRYLFDDVADGLALWEVLTFLAQDERRSRDQVERLVHLKEAGDQEEFQAGAAELLEDILAVRSRYGTLPIKLQAYLDLSKLGPEDQDLLDVAMALIIADPERREKAEAWFEDPETYEKEAAKTLDSLVETARSYLEVLPDLDE